MRYGKAIRASVNIATTHKRTRCSLRILGMAQTEPGAHYNFSGR